MGTNEQMFIKWWFYVIWMYKCYAILFLQLMQKEQSARNEYERRSREEVEAQYQNMKKMTDSEIQTLRDLIKVSDDQWKIKLTQ